MRSPVVLAVLASLACLGGALRAQDEKSTPDPLVQEIRVPLHDGRLDLAELVEALLDAYELDGDVLNLASERVDVRGIRGQLALFGIHELLLDTVRFRRSLRDDELTIVVDRVRTREVRRELRERVAGLIGHWTGDRLPEPRYGLALPADLDPKRPLVVLVHGMESSPAAWSDLRAFLAGDDLQIATFDYPNDGACDLAAVELAKALRARAPQRIRIVAHSMGGLIARAAVENPDLDPGNVDELILIGTPNHGSNLAGLRFALDAAHVLDQPDGTTGFGRALLEGVRTGLIDGLGEAGGDLLPKSVFLTRLNERGRNPTVDYHIVLGTRSILTATQLDAVRDRMHTLLGESEAGRLVRPRVDAFLADLPELVDGEGDGAVSVESGRLDGVEPALVPIDHIGLIRRRGLLGRITDVATHPVFERVRAWLEPAAK